MNGFLFWVDGRLAPPDFFSARTANTGTYGMVAYLTVASERLKKMPGAIDVFEIRSGSIVRRYNCDMGEGSHSTLPADDENPERLRFTCKRVANNIY